MNRREFNLWSLLGILGCSGAVMPKAKCETATVTEPEGPSFILISTTTLRGHHCKWDWNPSLSRFELVCSCAGGTPIVIGTVPYADGRPI
jgi:hypothetical protein